jgi:hypothetical protein
MTPEYEDWLAANDINSVIAGVRQSLAQLFGQRLGSRVELRQLVGKVTQRPQPIREQRAGGLLFHVRQLSKA